MPSNAGTVLRYRRTYEDDWTDLDAVEPLTPPPADWEVRAADLTWHGRVIEVRGPGRAARWWWPRRPRSKAHRRWSALR